jgi:hypothetical protein
MYDLTANELHRVALAPGRWLERWLINGEPNAALDAPLDVCFSNRPGVLPISQLGGPLRRGRSRGGHSDALFVSSRGATLPSYSDALKIG